MNTQAAAADAMQQAKQRLESGDARGAEAILRAMTARDSGNAEAFFLLGRAQLGLNRFADARRSLEACLRTTPGAWPALVELSKCHQFAGDFNRALEVCERALQLKPDSSEVVARKAEILRVMGRHTEAADLLEPIVSREDFGPGEIAAAVVYARIKAAQDDLPSAKAPLQRALALDSIPPFSKAQLHFQLASILDTEGAYDAAWEQASQGNAISGQGFDANAFAERVKKNLATWSKQRIIETPQAKDRRERLVFIIGPPRSGTTIVEQTLSRHPEMSAVGETEIITLAAQDLATGAGPDSLVPSEQAMKRIARKWARELKNRAANAPIIVEKTPTNFFYLPLIMKLFPASKIVLCRRNPLDVAVSCYFQNFGGALAWSCSLDGIATFFESFEACMKHWNDTLDVDIHELSYEEFVTDHEGRTRALLEFIGVEWDDACLTPEESERIAQTASLEQVRKPVHTGSVARHERYAAHLAPLRDRLGLS